MSATNRSAVRVAGDFYPTPAWCFRRLIESIPTSKLMQPGNLVLEPCVGSGALLDCFRTAGFRLSDTHATDLSSDFVSDVSVLFPEIKVRKADAQEFTAPDKPYKFICTNPPFNQAIPIIENLVRAENLAAEGVAAFLLRLNILEGQRRREFFVRHTPDVLVLPNRPGFRRTFGETDATAYAWFTFPGTGRWRIAAVSSLEERRADHVALWGSLRGSPD
jgi:hypothetical protein